MCLVELSSCARFYKQHRNIDVTTEDNEANDKHRLNCIQFSSSESEIQEIRCVVRQDEPDKIEVNLTYCSRPHKQQVRLD